MGRYFSDSLVNNFLSANDNCAVNAHSGRLESNPLLDKDGNEIEAAGIWGNNMGY